MAEVNPYLANLLAYRSGKPSEMVDPLAAAALMGFRAPASPASPVTAVESSGDVAVPMGFTMPVESSRKPASINSEIKALERRADAEQRANQAAQRMGIGTMLEQARIANEAPVQVDLSPLLALASQETGKNVGAGYTKPQSASDRIDMMNKIQQGIQKTRKDLSDEDLAYLKAKLATRRADAAAQSAASRADLMAQRLGLMQQSVGNRTDEQASKAAGLIHNNDIITKFKQRGLAVDRGLHLLQKNPQTGQNPSYQQMSEVLQDFSAALTGSNISSDFKLKDISVPSAQAELAKIASFVTSNPDQPISDKQLEYLQRMGNRLNASYDDAISTQAQNIARGRNYRHNPDAARAITEAVDIYKTPKWRSAGGFEEIPAAISASPKTGLPPDEQKELEELEKKYGGK